MFDKQCIKQSMSAKQEWITKIIVSVDDSWKHNLYHARKKKDI